MMLQMPFLAIERVLDLLRMPPLDNCYHSPELHPTAALNAIRLLEDMPDDYPMPIILPDGVGLKVEWLTSGAPVLIRITPNPGGVHATCGAREESGVGNVWKLLMESR